MNLEGLNSSKGIPAPSSGRTGREKEAVSHRARREHRKKAVFGLRFKDTYVFYSSSFCALTSGVRGREKKIVSPKAQRSDLKISFWTGMMAVKSSEKPAQAKVFFCGPGGWAPCALSLIPIQHLFQPYPDFLVDRVDAFASADPL